MKRRRQCANCIKRRRLFRGVIARRNWEPYYTLCYRCYQRHLKITLDKGQTICDRLAP